MWSIRLRDRCTAPRSIYPRSLNLKHIDVPDLERREKHNRTVLKEAKATDLRTGTLGNLKYIGKKIDPYVLVTKVSIILLVLIALWSLPGYIWSI